ncbi:DUF3800 domain-containing protein [Trueperella bialowiezensis]|uniref:Protein of uncharacterized function (DUF3800) n=1 Tax=Trueperella bialowiezensis TaxID=312285 RepID=A0A448PEY7_9ACTO|nr:DUF3800 domain-containing protein [Trueperella bialowiezensis]VEI13486.1 Protein of uncharacterised function (DUF3800) [Trueperella bialowiezensis]
MNDKPARIASIYLDESGAKNSAGGAFVVGFIKTYEPSLLWRAIRDIRQRHKETAEIKFSSINGKNIRFYFDLVEEIATGDYVARVGGSVYDSKTGFHPAFDTWQEQASMARKLIVGNINKNENVICFLDLVQTPRGVTVVENVKTEANRHLTGSPILEAYDVDSRAHDIIQLADVVAGAINYERSQAKTGRSRSDRNPKHRVMKRLQRALELDSFDDVKQGKVNILTMSGPATLPGLEYVE